MEKEIWKHVNGYEGILQVSNIGNVKEEILALKPSGKTFIYKKRILSNRTRFCRKNNSKTIQTTYKNKLLTTARLVAEAFLPNFNKEKHYIGYKDENPLNIHHKNLVCKEAFEVKHGGSNNHLSKINEQTVLEIIQMVKDGLTAKEISEKVGICSANIYRIAYNKIWRKVKREPIHFNKKTK